tara:strand:+ start:3330 stop:3533 length:204 start_codon:yes stop_codon:yes gene_type:complete
MILGEDHRILQDLLGSDCVRHDEQDQGVLATFDFLSGLLQVSRDVFLVVLALMFSSEFQSTISLLLF